MTLEQLEFILEVDREGTIVAAAEKLNISHTTISRAISALEDELGFLIFVRTRKGSTLTEKGRAALASARIILDEAERLRLLGKDAPREALRIGAYPMGSIPFLRDVVAQFNAKHPEITVFVDQSNVDGILRDVAEHRLDFGLMFYLPELVERISSDVEITEITDSTLMLLCSAKSHLARRPFVTPEDMRGESFVLQREDQITYMLRHMYTAEEMPNVIMHTSDNELIKSIVKANNAVATYTDIFISNDPTITPGEFACVPIWVDGKPYKLRYLYARPAKKPISSLERNFIRLLKKTVAESGQKRG